HNFHRQFSLRRGRRGGIFVQIEILGKIACRAKTPSVPRLPFAVNYRNGHGFESGRAGGRGAEDQGRRRRGLHRPRGSIRRFPVHRPTCKTTWPSAWATAPLTA